MSSNYPPQPPGYTPQQPGYTPQQPGYSPQPPGYTPQPPYGQPVQAVSPYGPPVQVNVTAPYGQAATKASGAAVASLVLGLIGIVFFWGDGIIVPFLCSILAIIFGHVALVAIKKANGWLSGKGMAIAGLVLGYIHVGIFVLLLILGAAILSSMHLR